mmetsp:Transcript_17554/g.26296  ORF Transcript_17554/g.26296 Transcript_17554/m.26296 type:complete len:133 (+) Transcript_17554:23-421(+)
MVLLGIAFAFILTFSPVASAKFQPQTVKDAEQMKESLKLNDVVGVMFFEGPNKGVREMLVKVIEKNPTIQQSITFFELENVDAGSPVGIQYSPALRIVRKGEVSSTIEYDFFGEDGFNEDSLSKFLVQEATA